MEQVTNGTKDKRLSPLILKSTQPFLIYLLVVSIISIPIYYGTVDALWKEEADEFNLKIAKRIEENINHLHFSDSELTQRIVSWNEIQSHIKIIPLPRLSHFKTKTFTSYQKKGKEIERQRILKTSITLNRHPYQITVDSSLGEADETIGNITAITIGFLILALSGLLLLTRIISKRLWQPFHNTLSYLRTFDLQKNAQINLPETDIKEFSQLNVAIGKLLKRSVSIYKSQKEFTENASHELQTPLAIIKNKLDLLLQDKDLTLEQYRLVEDINTALLRSSKLNKGLLLLAKLDNHQYEQDEQVRLSTLLFERLESWNENFNQRGIQTVLKIDPGIELQGNNMLAELLIDNLLLNAVRNTLKPGIIQIVLTHQKLTISNSGAEALNADSLFHRFSKLSHTGTGLGLAIVKAICDFHHWTLNYSFKEGFHHFNLIFN